MKVISAAKAARLDHCLLAVKVPRRIAERISSPFGKRPLASRASPRRPLAAPNQSATKRAHSKYVTELMDGVLSSLLAKLFVVTVVGAGSLYTQLNSINKEKK
jgi:hypothetical protein